MEISEIYGKIFPMEVDDNNTYTELKGDELNIVQLLEPTISVKEIVIDPAARSDAYAVPDRQSYRIPLVMINDIYIDQATLTNFSLDYSGFTPTVMIEFIDNKNKMLSVTSMKDGSIIKVYIGGLGDESYYKPIRQDFIVTEIRKTGGNNQNLGDDLQYRVSGKLNVPVGYKKESWSNFPCTSTQELFNLAVELGLGFATNFEKDTVDKMKWQNLPNTDYFDFIKDITAHACYSPNTFFTSFVDQYYVLNFVECHSLLSHGGKKTDVPAIIYGNTQQMEDSMDKNGKKQFRYNSEDNVKDEEKTNKWGSRFNNPVQRLTYYYISNNEYFNGWTNFIEEYVEISNGASSTNDGYRRNLGYNDYNPGDWGMSNVMFSIPPIDNLKRDSDTLKIQDLPDEATSETYIPINLVHATQTIYQTEEATAKVKTENTSKATSKDDKDASKTPTTQTTDSTANEGNTSTAGSVDDMSGTESFSYYGGVDTTNMFKLYYFAKEQNEFQMNCMKRCGLKVKLQNYNPAITKFSRIWVDIYDKNHTSSIAISKQEPTRGMSEYRKNMYENHNSDILSFPNAHEGEINRVSSKNSNSTDKTSSTTSDSSAFGVIKDSWGHSKYNRGLSGWYVVTSLKYVFDKKKLRLNTIMVLNRIEKKPLYKREYLIAKNAITKYAEDNVIEKLIKANDDLSYASSYNASNSTASSSSTSSDSTDSVASKDAVSGTTEDSNTDQTPNVTDKDYWLHVKNTD